MSRLGGLWRKRKRMILLVGLPALAVLLGLGFYLSGGRYISTDNAYVGAQKVLITPDISGKIIHVAIVEGQHVKPGDELFTLDPVPYRLALDAAKGKLDAARSDYDKLKTNLASLITLADLAQKNVELKQRDVDRKTSLVKSQAGSQADVDTVVGHAGDREIAGAVHRAAARHDAQPVARQSRSAAGASSPNTRRPRPRSTTPSAISITPPCARRSPAPRRRSTTSSSAASSPPARRSSA